MKRICVSLKTMLKTCDYNETYMQPKCFGMNGKWVLCVGSTGTRRSIRKSCQNDVRQGKARPAIHSNWLMAEKLYSFYGGINVLLTCRIIARHAQTTTVFGSHSASAKICLYLLLLLMRIFLPSSFCFVLSACCVESPKWNGFCIWHYLMLGVSLDFCVFGHFVAYYCWLISVGCVQRLPRCVHASTLISLISIAITFSVTVVCNDCFFVMKQEWLIFSFVVH